jgi:hypothetical protein
MIFQSQYWAYLAVKDTSKLNIKEPYSISDEIIGFFI